MQKHILLVLCLLTAKLSICQTGYPKKVLINKDTVVALTIEQVKLVNTTYLQLQEVKELNSVYKQALDTFYYLLPVYNRMDSTLKAVIAIQEKAINERDTALILVVKSVKEKEKTIKKLEMQNKVLKSGFVISLITIGILLIL